MNSINVEKVKQLIEPHFHTELNRSVYTFQKIKAKQLLTHTRLDIAFKLLYLEMQEHGVGFSKKIYTEHIRALSLGKFTEPGNEDKNSIERFIEDFHATFKDIETNGFDGTKTLIPLSQNGAIANGAHRVASAIYLNQEVTVVNLESYDHIYDYQFFYRRNIPVDILETVTTTFVEYADNVYIAFIWPVAKSNNEQIDALIPNIVYKKEIILNLNGAHNLLSQIYYGEEWLGTVENDFSGSKGKLLECFKSFDPVKIVVFQAESLEVVADIKVKIRETFDVGKHSIHITDTKEEAIRTARIVLNDNNIHFLNYAKPNRFLSTHKKIDSFKAFLKKNSLSFDDVIIDSSMVLSAYGLREAKDIDYLCSNSNRIISRAEEINVHDEVLIHYGKSKNELIYDSMNYFYFNDVKFISFAQLYKMKSSRAESKDRNDCKMMEALMENNRIKAVTHRLKQKFLYTKILLRQNIIELLQKLGIFSIARKLYRTIKGTHE